MGRKNFRFDDAPANPLFDEGISPLFGTETSDLAPVLAPQPLQIQEINRTGGGTADPITGALPTAKKKPQSKIIAPLAPLTAGITAGVGANLETPSAGEATVGVGTSVLAGIAGGALSGAVVGGVGAIPGAIIGGLSALVISGTRAWFGVRSARKRNREIRTLRRQAELQRQKDIARNEKWLRINNFNTLQQAEDNRKQQALQNKWEIFQNVSKNMTNLMNSDANLNQMLLNQMKGG